MVRVSRLLVVAWEKLTGGALSREEQAPRDEGAQDQEIEQEHGYSMDTPHVVELRRRKDEERRSMSRSFFTDSSRCRASPSGYQTIAFPHAILIFPSCRTAYLIRLPSAEHTAVQQKQRRACGTHN